MAAMLAAACILLWVITDAMGYDLFVAFVPATLILLFFSFPALHKAQRGRNGVTGTIGYWLMLIAGGLFALVFLVGIFYDTVMNEAPETALPFLFADDSPIFPIVFFGLILGILIFGIATLIAGVAPRLATLLFLFGLPLGVLLDFFILQSEDSQGPGFYIGIPMFAIGLLWLGWWVWSAKGSMSSAASSET